MLLPLKNLPPRLIDDGWPVYTKDHNLLSISGYIDGRNWSAPDSGTFDLAVVAFCTESVILTILGRPFFREFGNS